jgi:CCCH-type zinc finger
MSASYIHIIAVAQLPAQLPVQLPAQLPVQLPVACDIEGVTPAKMWLAVDICRFFQQGKCRNNLNCNFSHDSQSTKNVSAISNNFNARATANSRRTNCKGGL